MFKSSNIECPLPNRIETKWLTEPKLFATSNEGKIWIITYVVHRLQWTSAKVKLKKLQAGNGCSLIDIQSSDEICILNTKQKNAYRIMWVRVVNNENWWNDYSFIIIGSIIHAFAVEICISVSSSWMLQMEQTEEMHK